MLDRLPLRVLLRDLAQVVLLLPVRRDGTEGASSYHATRPTLGRRPARARCAGGARARDRAGASMPHRGRSRGERARDRGRGAADRDERFRSGQHDGALRRDGVRHGAAGRHAGEHAQRPEDPLLRGRPPIPQAACRQRMGWIRAKNRRRRRGAPRPGPERGWKAMYRGSATKTGAGVATARLSPEEGRKRGTGGRRLRWRRPGRRGGGLSCRARVACRARPIRSQKLHPRWRRRASALWAWLSRRR